jgi:putative transposase
MTAYRRTRAAGVSWFFTVNLADRSSALLIERIDVLRAALRYVRGRHPFAIDAMVVLPDHLHAVWTLPPGDGDFSLRWLLLKAYFSRQIPHGEYRRPSRITKGERGL